VCNTNIIAVFKSCVGVFKATFSLRNYETCLVTAESMFQPEIIMA
jgi:hypothetical protein